MKTLLIITVLNFNSSNVTFGYVDFDNYESCVQTVEKLKRQDVGNNNYKFEMICVKN